MSNVSNCILIYSVVDAFIGPSLDDINSFFDCKGFVSVNDVSLPVGWYGGDKVLEINILIGAFNYLDERGFIEHLRKLEWKVPESVRFIIKREHEDSSVMIDPLEGIEREKIKTLGIAVDLETGEWKFGDFKK